MSEDVQVRPIATTWLLDRADSLIEASRHPSIGIGSLEALSDEARSDLEKARTQVDAAVSVLIELGKRLLESETDVEWRWDLLLAIELLSDEFAEGDLR